MRGEQYNFSMTTEQVPDPESLKDIEEINPKELSDVLASALAEQVGGKFKVFLTKLEHTQPGTTGNRILLNFRIEDESTFYRWTRNSDILHRAYHGGEGEQPKSND